MKGKTILTFVLASVAVIGLGVGTFFVAKKFSAKNDGSITIKVIELNNVLIKEKEINYSKGETLPYIVENNFDNVVIENGMLMAIESITTPSDWSTFISIYHNNEISNYGINDLVFNNGDVISFINTEFIYE